MKSTIRYTSAHRSSVGGWILFAAIVVTAVAVISISPASAADDSNYAVGDTFLFGGVKYEITSFRPDTVKVIGIQSGYPEDIKIPSSITVALGKIKRTFEVTSIGDRAFDGCTGLESMVIPGIVSTIGDGAFSGCTSLRTVTVEGTIPANIGSNVFPKTVAINVPQSALQDYMDKWSAYSPQIQTIVPMMITETDVAVYKSMCVPTNVCSEFVVKSIA